jgi:hypothetical protein
MASSVFKINQVSRFQFVSDTLPNVLELDIREATQPVKVLSEYKRQTKPTER